MRNIYTNAEIIPITIIDQINAVVSEMRGYCEYE